MTTSCQTIISGAIGRSVGNNASDLSSNTRDMITRIAADEREIFTRIAKENRFFFGSFTVAPSGSSGGTSGRFVETAVAGNIERIFKVYIDTHANDPAFLIRPVDEDDLDAELAPRYYMQGTQIVEPVINALHDWQSVSTLTIEYALSPAALDPAGSATQTVTLPDRYADLLSTKLAAYFAGKDLESRDSAELTNLLNEYESRLKTVILSLSMFPGVVRRRFLNPVTWPVTSK